MLYETLLSVLGGYRCQVPARYNNPYALWTEVHITSVLPPEEAYKNMAFEQAVVQGEDGYEQLKRRINFIVYHWKTDSGEYCSKEIPMAKYKGYEELKKMGGLPYSAFLEQLGIKTAEPTQLFENLLAELE